MTDLDKPLEQRQTENQHYLLACLRAQRTAPFLGATSATVEVFPDSPRTVTRYHFHPLTDAPADDALVTDDPRVAALVDAVKDLLATTPAPLPQHQRLREALWPLERQA
ncbi:hypothetical protein [Deinococcus kurensis]|uniref:hypothetical protein n=1 Tax=Deinococcus kurensis TaxID=2662757 RepID=UPI0012D35A9B|nr:hypothetical protein [Deinococcus kurensis]